MLPKKIYVLSILIMLIEHVLNQIHTHFNLGPEKFYKFNEYSGLKKSSNIKWCKPQEFEDGKFFDRELDYDSDFLYENTGDGSSPDWTDQNIPNGDAIDMTYMLPFYHGINCTMNITMGDEMIGQKFKYEFYQKFSSPKSFTVSYTSKKTIGISIEDQFVDVIVDPSTSSDNYRTQNYINTLRSMNATQYYGSNCTSDFTINPIVDEIYVSN